RLAENRLRARPPRIAYTKIQYSGFTYLASLEMTPYLRVRIMSTIIPIRRTTNATARISTRAFFAPAFGTADCDPAAAPWGTPGSAELCPKVSWADVDIIRVYSPGAPCGAPWSVGRGACGLGCGTGACVEKLAVLLLGGP